MDRRSEFVVRFVDSVRDDTDFHKQYLVLADRVALPEFRERMTPGFTIDRVEQSAFGGGFEYYVRFDNDAMAVVSLAEAAGEVREAGFYLYPPKPD